MPFAKLVWLHETIRRTPAIEARLAKTLHDMKWIAELADSHYGA